MNKNIFYKRIYGVIAVIILFGCSSLPTPHKTSSATTEVVQFDNQIKNNSLTVDPSENLAVALYSDDSLVRVYNLKNHSLITTLDYVTPRNAQFAADGKSFYISDSSLGIIRQISVGDFSTLREINIGKGAFGFAIDGKYMFVNNEAENTLSVINLNTWQVEHAIDGFANPRQGIKVGPSGKYVYVTNFQGDDVRIVNTETWKIERVLSGIPGVRAIAISPDETKLYGASSQSNSLRVVLIQSNQLIKAMPTEKDPYGTSLSKDGKILITGNKEDNSVQVFDTSNYKLIKTIRGFNEPRQAIVYSKTQGQIYVLQKDLSIAVVNYNSNPNNLTIIK
jgi:DNA-binding beta-propeller fold protein YncE